jgi:hypothetical protein
MRPEPPRHTICPPPLCQARGPEVDLYQGASGPGVSMVKAQNTPNALTQLSMPPLSKFKKFDVRPLLEKGREPLPEILKRIEALKPEEGLILIAPFLPSPLIERLGSEGFESKVEPAQGGQWIVYFWRENQPTV